MLRIKTNKTQMYDLVRSRMLDYEDFPRRARTYFTKSRYSDAWWLEFHDTICYLSAVMGSVLLQIVDGPVRTVHRIGIDELRDRGMLWEEADG
mgnify:CR=1 FL=1